MNITQNRHGDVIEIRIDGAFHVFPSLDEALEFLNAPNGED